MGKLIVSEFVSIDGVMEAPGGEEGYAHTGWVLRAFDQEWLDHKQAELMAFESHLLGRKTYESFAGAWPDRDGPMAEKINAMPKYVASSTLKKLDWNNSHLLIGDTAAAVSLLKAENVGDILVAGSHTLLQTLKANNLIDEYRMMVFPVVLGSGMKMFDETPERMELALIGTEVFKCGVVEMRWGRKG